MPGHQLYFGDAFADVGHLDDVDSHVMPPSRVGTPRRRGPARESTPIPAHADREYPSRLRVRWAPPGGGSNVPAPATPRSEEHTSELQSLMRISYAVFCLKKKN